MYEVWCRCNRYEHDVRGVGYEVRRETIVFPIGICIYLLEYEGVLGGRGGFSYLILCRRCKWGSQVCC